MHARSEELSMRMIGAHGLKQQDAPGVSVRNGVAEFAGQGHVVTAAGGNGRACRGG